MLLTDVQLRPACNPNNPSDAKHRAYTCIVCLDYEGYVQPPLAIYQNFEWWHVA
jgi:hypothetical protein